jgi:DNA-binding NtrC family response regulator
MAHDGTLFLDEVGEMSLRMQSLLLRFLESGEVQRVGAHTVQARVNVRIISSTNRDLIERIASKMFREDLYYRLNVIHITVPPLRDRREDIPLLLNHFLRAFARLEGIDPPRLTADAVDHLAGYDWPGNVRQLRNTAERLIARAGSRAISVADLPDEIRHLEHPPATAVHGATGTVADELFERMVERRESFWTAVYPPFMSHDITRADVREVLQKGFERIGGSYKGLIRMFNIDEREYRRFVNFLRKHGCHIPFQNHRSSVPVQDTDISLLGR